MALAAMIFGKWHPVGAFWACLLFGFLDAVAIRLQGVRLPGIGAVPVPAIQALPYVLTVVLLAGFIGRAWRRPTRRALREGALMARITLADEPQRSLLQAARAARLYAYAPYSKFPVGAAVLDEQGHACRLQCRERRLSAGRVRRGRGAERPGAGRRPPRHRVAGGGRRAELVTPCGGCRQKLREFGAPDTPVLVADGQGVQRGSRSTNCCRTASAPSI